MIEGEICSPNGTIPLVAICMHTKSKFIADGYRKWKSLNDEERDKFIRHSVKNRRRIAGECLRLRRAIDKLILAPAISAQKDPFLLVSGDLNVREREISHLTIFDRTDQVWITLKSITCSVIV